MPKIFFETLAVEITRRCNLHCDHCMRGDAQNKDLNPTALENLFAHTGSIATLVPTGGEPSLHIPGLTELNDTLDRYSIDTSSIYLVTNGVDITIDFMTAFLKLYARCDDMDMCGLALSQDMFHEPAQYRMKQLLRTVSCFRDDDKKTDWKQISLLNMGRAKNLSGFSSRDQYLSDPFEYAELDDEGNIRFSDATIALTVDGDLLSACDYAYDDINDIKLANVLQPNWFDRFYEKATEAIQLQTDG